MKVLPLFAIACLSKILFAESVDVTIRRAPYDVPNVSSKSEIAKVQCRYCDRTTNYYRTYDWDVHKHVWVETTKSENVPDVCRRCRAKCKGKEKLDTEERELDRQIECEKTKIRIERKKAALEKLRQKSR